MSFPFNGIRKMPPDVSVREAAIAFYRAGFSVIPILAQTKIPFCKWEPWLEGLSEEKIREHFDGFQTMNWVPS
jgi:hypothetical protein